MLFSFLIKWKKQTTVWIYFLSSLSSSTRQAVGNTVATDQLQESLFYFFLIFFFWGEMKAPWSMKKQPLSDTLKIPFFSPLKCQDIGNPIKYWLNGEEFFNKWLIIIFLLIKHIDSCAYYVLNSYLGFWGYAVNTIEKVPALLKLSI